MSASLHREEMSDFTWIGVPQKETDIHPMPLMVNQIGFGKTDHGHIFLWKSNPLQRCEALLSGFHLSHRFCLTDEFACMTVEDWMNNESWFDIKLLADMNTNNNTKRNKK